MVFLRGLLRRLDQAGRSGEPGGKPPTVLGFATGISFPVDLQVGPDGALYYLANGSGAVFRIAYTADQAPTITTQPASQQVSVGQPATFGVTASGTPPLAFQWKRNGMNIPGATGSSFTLPSASLADNGAAFQCQVSNAFGSATSNPATLTVVQNKAPTGTITAPAAGALYSAGQTITYTGTATDPEDGVLPASAFTWWVVFHHDEHTHPFLPETTGAKGGSFTIPTSGETSANVWYRIYLRMRDSGGLTHVSYRDVRPKTVTLTLATAPAGLKLTLDGQPVTAPFSVQAVVGMRRTLAAPPSQMLNGKSYTFRSWSDRGAAAHEIAVSSTSKIYTASYQLVGSARLSNEYGPQYSGQSDFCPDDRWAYFGVGKGLRIHVLNIDGTDDIVRVLESTIPGSPEGGHGQSLRPRPERPVVRSRRAGRRSRPSRAG